MKNSSIRSSEEFDISDGIVGLQITLDTFESLVE